MNRRIRWIAFWILSFASIASLMTHLPGWLSMATWGFPLLPIGAIGMAGLIAWGAYDGDDEFLRCVWLGAIGGLIGTIGYDVFRIPFHHQGLNLLSPIRAYGMWLCGASSSSYTTDIIGFAYHLSNGITFGWIYALLFHRKSFWWAIGWGLILETLAIVSPFGEVFGLRQYSNAVLLAYFAHIFYGWPLGVICEDRKPESERRWSQIWDKHQLSITIALTLFVGSWFVLVRPAGDGRVPVSVVNVGSDRILPTWADLTQGSSLIVNNPNESQIKIRIRSPSPSGHIVTEYSILSDQSVTLTLDESGIYQLDCATHSQWRSVFWSVSLEGDYRTRR